MKVTRNAVTSGIGARIVVEVDRVYGADASKFVVQVLRYAADAAGAPIGQPVVFTAAPVASGTPRLYVYTDTSIGTGRYVYQSRVVHTGGTVGPAGVQWRLQKTS